ncbi:MAG: sel1 repeat family protein [Burkholderiales bacterium]|nr:sel1 repeat family protein [Burkholderiales bacterium]
MNDTAPPDDPVPALEARATAGEVRAMFELGLHYDLPARDGREPDIGLARAWYTQAAEAGHPWAQFALGNIYDRAQGVPRDPAIARRWYEAAALQGITEAQMHLGSLLQTGQGGEVALEAAAEWFDKAAQGGHELAATNLALMHLGGQVAQPDIDKARDLLGFAADKLDGLAHLALGDLYAQGKGVERHGGLALVHYCVAVMLLPPGPNRERAEQMKAHVLKRHRHRREEYEQHARAFIEARTPPTA